MSITPNARTLAALRKDGYIAAVVEKRLPHCHTTKDLFGCIDVLAVKPGKPTLGVQATTRTNQAARVKKAIGVADLRIWLKAGCEFAVWGWACVGGRGKVKRWRPSIRFLTLEDLPAVDTAVSNQPEVDTAVSNPEDGQDEADSM